MCPQQKTNNISRYRNTDLKTIEVDTWSPKLVGVFMNQAIDDVCRLCEEYGIDVVQLHGDENWKDYYTVLQKGIIKKMEFPRDCSLVEQMSDSSDKCLPLFDTGGGTGEKLRLGQFT